MHSIHAMMWRGVMVVAGVCALAGCSDAEVCDGDCPRVGGIFQIEATSPAQGCEFTPWLIGPTLEVRQEPGASSVLAELIDPVNQIPVQLAGDVLRPEDPGVGVFQMEGQTNRQTTDDSKAISTFQLLLRGSVTQNETPPRLSATLTTTEIPPSGSGGCQQVLHVIGRQVDGS